MIMERLDAANAHPENQDPVKQSVIEQAVKNFKENLILYLFDFFAIFDSPFF